MTQTLRELGVVANLNALVEAKKQKKETEIQKLKDKFDALYEKAETYFENFENMYRTYISLIKTPYRSRIISLLGNNGIDTKNTLDFGDKQFTFALFIEDNKMYHSSYYVLSLARKDLCNAQRSIFYVRQCANYEIDYKMRYSRITTVSGKCTNADELKGCIEDMEFFLENVDTFIQMYNGFLSDVETLIKSESNTL